jgi:hypothetical protein
LADEAKLFAPGGKFTSSVVEIASTITPSTDA